MLRISEGYDNELMDCKYEYYDFQCFHAIFFTLTDLFNLLRDLKKSNKLLIMGLVDHS